MRSLRILLSITVASWMMGPSILAIAQESDSSPFSITLAPLQYAQVKGNVGKFEALNWMPNGAVAGVSDISFVKDINKDISLSVDGSEFTNDDGTGQLTLKDGDLAFLKIDYNAFRKYFDNTGGVSPTPAYSSVSNVKANSPDLQMDISYFKLEAGLGPISDPYLDVTYEHDSKNGDKSLEQWASATSSAGSEKLAPSWESINDTVDRVTLKEQKEFAGITMKGDQTAEIDYNSNITNMQNISYLSSATNTLTTENESPDAKLFGAGVRFEKWMLNDNTFAGLGYHYNHIHDTDLMQNYTESISSTGVITPLTSSNASLWNFSHALEDDHVWVGNLNTNLTPNLDLVTDVRYEHMGSEGSSTFYPDATLSTASAVDVSNVQNHEDQEGEHAELRYSGISHTTLYAETEFNQDRNWNNESFENLDSPSSTSNFTLDRLDRTQDESWTLGGRVVPNRFFTFSNQLKQHGQDSQYDTITSTGSTGLILMQSLREKGVDDTSTLTWKPYHWLQNSLKYQFSDNVYNPQLAPQVGAPSGSHGYIPLPADGSFNITENHMLTSQFTYDITVQPIDPLLLMFTYSHVENYVRTVGASNAGLVSEQGPTFIPDFTSNDNSWLFSDSYTPWESLVWTNTVCYTLSDNYVDYSSGIPYGSDFRMLNLTTSLEWTYHKWLKIGPMYEHASYRDTPLAGEGNYSANIFMLDAKFSW